MEIRCGGCTACWTGTNRAHCASCHRTFSGLSAFDSHQRGGECWPPRQVDLVVVAHAGNQQIWGRHLAADARPAHWGSA